MEVIDVNRKILSKVKNYEAQEDVIVPDVKPDILNIISTNGIPYVYKKEQSDGTVKLDGNIDVNVIYLSVDGDTRCVQTTLKFSSAIDENQIKESSYLKYNIQISNIESKVLNERKISISSSLIIKYDLYEKQKLEIYNDFENIEDLQKQENELDINSLVGINSVKASVKEDIKIDNLDNAVEILKLDVSVANSETKISYNKVLAKADVNVKIMYLTEDERIVVTNSNLPLMNFIEIENVKEENICNLDYNIRNILIKINGNDEHSITCQIEFEITCEAYENKNIKIVNDLYSLKSDIEYDSKEVEIDMKSTNSGYPVKIDERIGIEDVKKVLDVDSNAKIVKLTNSNDNSSVEGEVELKIYYEVSSKSGLNVKSVNIPFISKTQIGDNVSVKIEKNEFDLESADLIIKMELSLNSLNSNEQKINLIENVKVNETVPSEDYSVVVYFVKPGDTLWKIAKRFKVTVDSIVKINNIDNPDLIYPGDKLYILK